MANMQIEQIFFPINLNWIEILRIGKFTLIYFQIRQKLFLLKQMTQSILTVLYISCALLTIFLLISLFQGKPDKEVPNERIYHLGCYDENSIIDYSHQIQQRKRQIEQTVRQNSKLGFSYMKVLTPAFDQEVQSLAQAFQIYLSKYHQFKITNDAHIEYQKSIQTAHHQYLSCKGTIDLDQKKCLTSWKQYESHSVKIQVIKKQLNELLGSKQQRQKKLQNLILSSGSSNDGQYQQKFRLLIDKNRQSITTQQQRIIKLSHQIDQYRLQANNLIEKSNQITLKIQQCITNQQSIKYCLQLSQQMVNFDKTTWRMDVSEIEKKLQSKLLILQKLQGFLQVGILTTSERDHFLLSKEEVKKEIQLIQSQLKQHHLKFESLCQKECSPQGIKKKKQQIQEIWMKNGQIEEKIKKNLFQKQESSKLIVKLKGQNELLRSKLELVNRRQCRTKYCDENFQKQIEAIRKQIYAISLQIWQKQSFIIKLKEANDLWLSENQQNFQELYKISNCLRKKEYYEELIKKGSVEVVGTITYQDQRKMLKNSLIALQL